jgi:hypothetical protein
LIVRRRDQRPRRDLERLGGGFDLFPSRFCHGAKISGRRFTAGKIRAFGR